MAVFPDLSHTTNDKWADWYTEMESFLKNKLSAYKVERISHIGSTAIKGIWAKPIIDILVEISENESMPNVSETLCRLGFRKMSEGNVRMSFNLGYTEVGFAEMVYHLHLRYAGDNEKITKFLGHTEIP